jgi:DMSO/TMAO reductase YedYZ molybdopterin-dependent catalytic subunit
MNNPISRRRLIAGAAGIAGVTAATTIASRNGLLPPDATGLYGCGHALTYAAHRLLAGDANAREFDRSRISKIPHPKGNPPKGEEFARLQVGGFRNWTLKVEGMVRNPTSLSIADLKTQVQPRSQITQLICEEGWSYIAEWTGAPLSQVLQLAGGALPEARFLIYHSMDGWRDAIDFNDVHHPQTLVSYGMNGGDVAVGHGGPLRMRVPRQLGYKSLKFLHRITLTDTLQGGGFEGSYSWYAGI